MNKFFTVNRIILVLILMLAAMLRFWNLGNVPPSASMDEASIGYNAYSVLKTGGDEYGKFPLISQRSYDDWRRSTYLLLVVPSVALLGLNVIAVRLPSVLLSILTVWATYHIALLLFTKQSKFSSNFALLSAFLLAISPWHIYISRLGHESNACLSFLVFGVLFFLRGLKNIRFLFLSIVFFTLSMISYYSGQVFIPLFAFGLLYIFRRDLSTLVLSNKKILILFVISAVLLVPIFWAIFSPEALVRFRGTSTFSPEAHSELFNEQVLLRNKAVEDRNIFGIVYYNRRLFPLKVFLEGYIAHFNANWLFTNPSSDSFKAPHIGLLYVWEIPFILIGIAAFLLSPDVDPKIKKLILLWFFLAPVPASIATQVPHAMRSYNFLPTWQILTAFGLVYAVSKLPRSKAVILTFITVSVAVGFVSFCKNYFIVFPKEQSNSFHYALSKAIPYVLSLEKDYQKVIFSNKDSLRQSYMVFLYYSHFDPSLYQRLGGTGSGGFAETHSFARYEFRPISWEKDQLLSNTLFVGNASDFPKQLNGTVFTDLDGEGAIAVVQR